MNNLKLKIKETLIEQGFCMVNFDNDYEDCIDNCNFEYNCNDAENHNDFEFYCTENWK